MYYADKMDSLRDIFGCADISLRPDQVTVAGKTYRIVDDVIILLDEAHYPGRAEQGGAAAGAEAFSPAVQETFGREWMTFPEILPEHESEFRQYFDIVDVEVLTDQRVCDLGCGIGRWSYFLSESAGEVVLVDFSEAIYVARRNLRHAANALFFMADIKRLPFRNDFAGFIYCIGVLHHLPTDALDEVRALKRLAPELLVYLYSSLDARPPHYAVMLAVATGIRRAVCHITNPIFRAAFTWFALITLYMPLVLLGRAASVVSRAHWIPLVDYYGGKGLKRIRQDVYDRFFTPIEQRVSRRDILGLCDTFDQVIVSDGLPYWHFLCRR